MNVWIRRIHWRTIGSSGRIVRIFVGEFCNILIYILFAYLSPSGEGFLDQPLGVRILVDTKYRGLFLFQINARRAEMIRVSCCIIVQIFLVRLNGFHGCLRANCLCFHIDSVIWKVTCVFNSIFKMLYTCDGKMDPHVRLGQSLLNIIASFYDTIMNYELIGYVCLVFFLQLIDLLDFSQDFAILIIR